MTCFFCDSPSAHPATGAQYGPRVLACAACVRTFWRWFMGHQRVRGSGLDFYAAAGKFREAAR